MKIAAETHYLRRAVDHEGEILESVVTKRRNRKPALGLLKRLIKTYGRPMSIVSEKLRSKQPSRHSGKATSIAFANGGLIVLVHQDRQFQIIWTEFIGDNVGKGAFKHRAYA